MDSLTTETAVSFADVSAVACHVTDPFAMKPLTSGSVGSLYLRSR